MVKSSRPLKPIGFEQSTSRLHVPAATATTKLTAGLSDVRWRDDGTAATPTVGHLLSAGKSVWYFGDAKKLRFNGTVDASFYEVL